ncbi:MAG: hypothetical protein RIK87_22290 [Fuerstiella sp.]
MQSEERVQHLHDLLLDWGLTSRQLLLLHNALRESGLTLTESNSEYGDDTDHWPGKAITLWPDPSVMYAGKRVGGVRIRPTIPQGQSVPQQAPPQPVPAPVQQVPNQQVFS